MEVTHYEQTTSRLDTRGADGIHGNAAGVRIRLFGEAGGGRSRADRSRAGRSRKAGGGSPQDGGFRLLRRERHVGLRYRYRGADDLRHGRDGALQYRRQPSAVVHVFAADSLCRHRRKRDLSGQLRFRILLRVKGDLHSRKRGQHRRLLLPGMHLAHGRGHEGGPSDHRLRGIL